MFNTETVILSISWCLHFSVAAGLQPKSVDRAAADSSDSDGVTEKIKNGNKPKLLSVNCASFHQPAILLETQCSPLFYICSRQLIASGRDAQVFSCVENYAFNEYEGRCAEVESIQRCKRYAKSAFKYNQIIADRPISEQKPAEPQEPLLQQNSDFRERRRRSPASHRSQQQPELKQSTLYQCPPMYDGTDGDQLRTEWCNTLTACWLRNNCDGCNASGIDDALKCLCECTDCTEWRDCVSR